MEKYKNVFKTLRTYYKRVNFVGVNIVVIVLFNVVLMPCLSFVSTDLTETNDSLNRLLRANKSSECNTG